MSIEAGVESIVREHFGIPHDHPLDDGESFESLGADDMGHLEIIMALELEFDVDIDDDVAEGIETARQAVIYLEGVV